MSKLQHKILSKTVQELSPWVKLSTKRVGMGGDELGQTYHSLVMDDYVNVLAITKSGEIPLVRQFRPALESYSLELPGGHVDEGVDPATSAERELYEETGHHTTGPLKFLGCLDPDSGRLENRVWCYCAINAFRPAESNWVCESGIEVSMVSKIELRAAIDQGRFKHAMHIATIALAALKGHVTL